VKRGDSKEERYPSQPVAMKAISTDMIFNVKTASQWRQSANSSQIWRAETKMRIAGVSDAWKASIEQYRRRRRTTARRATGGGGEENCVRRAIELSRNAGSDSKAKRILL